MSENHSHLREIELLLIKGCIAGDRAFQTKLYDLYAPKMLGVCMRYSKNREEAEEVLQEGFLRMFKYIKKFRGEGSFEGWIRKIMVNAALMKFRGKITLSPVIQIDTAKNIASSESGISSQLDTMDLLSLVQSLPTRYRMVFNLYVFEGYKHREIALLLGITEGTSKSNLFDARSILQNAILLKKKLVHYK